MPKRNDSYELSLPTSYNPSAVYTPYASGQSCTAVIGSMTKAMQAQRALAEASVRASVQKVSSTQAGGCVYGVSYACNQDQMVREILSYAGIRVRKYMT